MPSKKRKYNARFPAGRIKKIMRIDDEIGKVALPVPVMISRALELFVSSLLHKAGDITMQKNARTLTLTHLKQCIHSDNRLDFLKELVKDVPDRSEECIDNNSTEPPTLKTESIANSDSEDETSPCPTSPSAVAAKAEDDSIERHLSNARQCLCRLSAEVCTAQLRARPETTGSHAAAHLSAMRLLLVARRRQQSNPPERRCAAVQRACSALLLDGPAVHPSWPEYLMDALQSPDEYVGHAAVYAVSETLLFRADDDGADARLMDGLSRLARAGSATAVNAFARALDTSWDDGERCAALRTTLLRGLHDAPWTDVVDAATATPALQFELMRLWKSVLSAAPDPRGYELFYSSMQGPLLQLLFSVDTEPRKYMNAARLLGTGLSADYDGVPGAATGELATLVIEGLADGRLLYSMRCKVRNGVGGVSERALLQETTLLAMRSLRAYARGTAAVAATAANAIVRLDSYVKSCGLYAPDVPFARWMVRLASDRDDDAAVECLTCALDASPLAAVALDPLVGFAEFLACASHDADVLLDLLIADDGGRFLRYAVRVLKTVCRDADAFFRHLGLQLDDTMATLIRLRLKTVRLHSHGLFPYNVEPLARLIQQCEEMYGEFIF